MTAQSHHNKTMQFVMAHQDCDITLGEFAPGIEMKIARAVIEIDWQKGGPVRCQAEGWLVKNGEYVMTVDPEWTVRSIRDGRKYKLVPVEEET